MTVAVRPRTRTRWLAPVLVFLGVLALWELWVRAAGIQGFLLPPPTDIITTLADQWRVVWPAGFFTLREAVGGLIGGSLLGILGGFATARWSLIREGVLPFSIAASSAPIVALAPITNQWFGITNPVSKMMVAALLVFFPVMINVTRGLTQVEPSALELMHASAASEGQVLRKVRIPSALPYFFTALKVCTTLSLIGAVVAEYFGGSSDVLGRVIVQSSSRLRFDITWAAITITAVSGIVMYLVALAVERLVIPWHASQRNAES